MTEQHPITPPPPHLLKKFSAQAQDEAKKRNGAGYLKTFATLCIEWAMNSKTTPNDRQIRSSEIEPSFALVEQWHISRMLRAIRRPKPPSLKEQVLKSLEGLVLPDDAFTTISHALKRLQELEGEQSPRS